MVKKNNMMILAAIALGIFIISQGGVFTGAITGDETMTRNGPVEVSPGQTYTITYQAHGASGQWAASIEDAVSGGCTFPNGGTTLRTVMISDEGNTKSISINAPSSDSTCVFSGNYQFGTEQIKNLNAYSTNVVACQPVCTRPANLCIEAASISNGCGGQCTGSWTVNRNTNADTNCDNSVSRNELGSSITSWISGGISRTELGQAIVAWVGG